MPWSGSGVYTRGYASWTSDATGGLPISATKFDLEDNDFAAGIQNCLTIDGQNKPNATLTWAQTLALTKGTNSTVFSIARTGGSNNPSLTFNVSDAANSVTGLLGTGNAAFVLTPAAYAFGNSTDAPTFAFAGAGVTSTVGTTTALALTLNSPAAGQSAMAYAVNNVLYAYSGVAGFAGNLVTGAALGDLVIRSVGNNIWFSVDNGVTVKAALTSAGIFQISDNAASPTLFTAGYLDCPQNAKGTNYTLLLSDRGKQIGLSANNVVVTIPANSVTAFPVGTVIVIATGAATGCTIAINTDTLNLAGTATTGTRTLSSFAVVALTKINSTGWLVSGAGLS